MGNIMTSMWTGVAGLKTNQASLNTVSHNLANVNTDGYVRQQVVQADTIYNTIGSSSVSMLQVGYGTTVQAIRQVRDVFLDKAYRVEVGRQGFYEAESEATQEVETLFGELEGEAFHENITDFWTSLQELVKEPDSIVKRAAVVSEASTLVERASNIYSALESYQKNLNTKISDKVNRINEIGEQIVSLNKQIMRYECGSENANDLRDTRNALLDELGEIVKISYTEDSTGNLNVSIEGTQFVWDNSVSHLTVERTDDTAGLLNVVWDDASKTPLYDLTQECTSANNTNVGSLKGVLIARGTTTANYTDIPNRDDYATDGEYSVAVKTFNENINQSIIMSTMAQFDQLIHGIVTAINDILSPNTSGESFLDSMGIAQQGDDSYTITDKDGNTSAITNLTITDANGNSYELSDLKDVQVWDEANAPVGMDADNTPRQELFERKYTERYTEATIEYTDENGDVQQKKVYIYNEEDPDNIYSLYTIGQIQVNEEIQKEVSLLPLSGTTSQGMSDAYAMDKCQELVDAFNIKFATLNPNELTSYTFAEYYTALVGDIATKGDKFESMAAQQDTVASNINTQRSTILDVSSEEELTNMIKYQYGYAANSKYINVINEMLDTIINSMG